MLRCVLRCFEAVSGLRLNLTKSIIIRVGSVPNIDLLVANLGCSIGLLPFHYLGLPLGAFYKSIEA